MNILPGYKVIGISHHLSSMAERSRCHLAGEREKIIYKQLAGYPGFKGFILSTCNRTEIYYHGLNQLQILDNWGKVVLKPLPNNDRLYFLSGTGTVRHLMKVACGADSQILGDREITGQIRRAYRNSQANQCLDGVWEKILNSAIATSRKVKRTTEFHSGNISPAFEISKMLKNRFHSETKNVLIIGAGELSRNLIKYLAKYNPDLRLHITNRTRSKSVGLAEDWTLTVLPWNEFSDVVGQFDIIISAIQTDDFVLLLPRSMVKSPVWIFDLGIPRNFDYTEMSNTKIRYWDLDSISLRIQSHLKTRNRELPKVREIIHEEVKKIKNWARRRYLFNKVLKHKSMRYETAASG